VFALFWGGAVVLGPTFADDPPKAASGKKLGEADIAKELRDILVAQNEAKQNEDLPGTVKDIDENLASRYSNGFLQVFRTFKLDFSLDDFKLLYHDDEIALARVKQTMKKIEGPEFKDNQRDALQIFRKRDGQWKIHEQAILDHYLLDAEGKPGEKAAPPKPLRSLQSEISRPKPVKVVVPESEGQTTPEPSEEN
jgi:hypothetical protein